MKNKKTTFTVVLVIVLFASLGACAYLVYERKNTLESLREKEAEISAIVQQNKSLVEENDSLQQTIEAKDKMQEIANARIAQFEQDLKVKEGRLTDLDKTVKEADKLSVEMEALRDGNAALKAENTALKSANESLRQENNALKTRKKGWFGK